MIAAGGRLAAASAAQASSVPARNGHAVVHQPATVSESSWLSRPDRREDGDEQEVEREPHAGQPRQHYPRVMAAAHQ